MSLTENDFEQDTLEILASLQPTRSLPSTPLVAKRPVDFIEYPTDSPTFLRKAAGSPALTIDSTLSTPTHSATASPTHSPAKNTKESHIQVKKEIVEIETHLLNETQTKPETPPIVVPSVVIREASPPVETIPEDSVLESELLSTEHNEEVAPKQPISSKPKEMLPVEPPPPPLPEFMTKKFTWDEIRDVLEFNEEGPLMDYEGILPPEDPVWLSKPTSVEQLRAFLLSCP